MTTGCWYCGGIDGHVLWCQHDVKPGRECTTPPLGVFQGMGSMFTPLPDLKDSLLVVIDRQLEIERKARSWDSLRQHLEGARGAYYLTLAEDGASWTAMPAPPARDQDPGKG